MRAALAIVAVLTALASAAGQPTKPTVRIVVPQDRSYVSGEVSIKALVTPESAPVERVVFVADGARVCTVTQRKLGLFECTWRTTAEVREHAIRVVAYLRGGQSVSANVLTGRLPSFAENVDVDLVRLSVVVLDGTRFVRGLKVSDFRVFEDGVRQPISHFEAENAALELVSAIDFSDSMTASMSQVHQVVKQFLGSLRPTDRVWLVGFNERFYVLSRPTDDLPFRLQAVDRVGSWGATALYDVIIKSFDLLQKQPNRSGIVAFTDGDDTASRQPKDAVERRAESSEAVLYMIGQGRAADSPDLRALCDRLAIKSGGRAFFPRSVDDLGETFDQILEELANQYFLTYPPPAGTDHDGKYHKIRVEVTNGRYKVRARDGVRR